MTINYIKLKVFLKMCKSIYIPKLVSVDWFVVDRSDVLRPVEVDAGTLGTPSLYPSIFVNIQNGRNDHMVSPTRWDSTVTKWYIDQLLSNRYINIYREHFPFIRIGAFRTRRSSSPCSIKKIICLPPQKPHSVHMVCMVWYVW